MATSDFGPTRRLFVTDINTKVNFLIGTDANLCVYSRRMVREPRQRSPYELTAANETIIHIYGTEVNVKSWFAMVIHVTFRDRGRDETHYWGRYFQFSQLYLIIKRKH